MRTIAETVVERWNERDEYTTLVDLILKYDTESDWLDDECDGERHQFNDGSAIICHGHNHGGTVEVER